MGQKNSKTLKKGKGIKGPKQEEKTLEIPRESPLGWLLENWENSTASAPLPVPSPAPSDQRPQPMQVPVPPREASAPLLLQEVASPPPVTGSAAPLLPPPSQSLLDLPTPPMGVQPQPQVAGPPYPQTSFQPPFPLPPPSTDIPLPPTHTSAPQHALSEMWSQTSFQPGTKKQTSRTRVTYSPPRTRRQARRLDKVGSESEDEGHHVLPLREITTAPGIIGYVNVPINTRDVRAFKKEMGRLMDDLFGVAERLDEFLGTSIYSYEDMASILRSLFNTEETEMIRQAGIRDWERRNPQGVLGEQKWPSQDPRWNAQTEEGRRNMIDLRNIIIQGIREAVPRGQNLSKVLGECQGKDETLTEWLNLLRKGLQIYSGTDTDSPIGEVLLKTQFVAKSWENIRRKLEKIGNWQEKGLQELLREAQKEANYNL
uniref:Core shell protein Gag P30 domain-containing protein n=1 Tax=Cyanoderma ruficeps TaxID=181631 RepID=A0A8C3P171_9PASS